MSHPRIFRIITFIFSIFIFSCSSDKKENTDASSPNQHTDNVITNQHKPLKAVLIKEIEVPTSLSFKGKIEEAYKWEDKNGENILLLTSLITSKEDEYGPSSSKYIFAYNYIQEGSSYKLLWKMNDLVEECPTDLICNFFEGATTVTDLDMDGIAEVKLQYEQGCISDVSPSGMKLLFYEDGKKRALRGVRWTDVNALGIGNRKEFPYSLDNMVSKKRSEFYSDFGRYQSESDFKNDPPVFLNFVRQEWRKYVVMN